MTEQRYHDELQYLLADVIVITIIQYNIQMPKCNDFEPREHCLQRKLTAAPITKPSTNVQCFKLSATNGIFNRNSCLSTELLG